MNKLVVSSESTLFMHRALIINSVCGTGSTGRIAAGIATEYETRGWEVRYAYGRDAYVPESYKKWAVRIGNQWSVRLHGFLTRLFDLHGTGCCSYLATRRFIRWAEAWKPDMVWLHNLHGYYINYELLFKWLKRHPEIEVKWTLHDCWAFTGHCSHFMLTDCDRWQYGCYKCPEKGEYPASKFLSAVKSNWERKRKAFCGVKKMTLITPSKWLAGLVQKSFLRDYPVTIIHNTIDHNVFKSVISDCKVRLGIGDKVMILGVASAWDRRKGLDDMLRLRKLLDDRCSIVLVGLDEKQVASLPAGIIGIVRTNSVQELSKLYCASDWFFNPTHEDSYPTVNLEARACGCRIATYDTGGASETVEGYDKAWVLKGEDKSPEGFVRLLQSTGIESV